MKIITKKIFPDFSLPLPIYTSIHIADGVGKDGEEFDVYVGLNEKQAEQVKNLSLDENDSELQNNTGDLNRFGYGSYEDWYKKNRTPFCVIHKRTDALAALIWFGPKLLGKKSIKFGKAMEEGEQSDPVDNWHTIVFRSYPPFRGKGLMKNFALFAMDIYKKHFPHAMFWLGTNDGNKGMRKLGLELNFEPDENASDLSMNWLVMIKK